ncbi:MAG: hypothetical protein DM484_08010 [Candidatus Methylumidiphilus alinenensis]|uniref:Sulfatase-modifying factor enzyme-like domain-containing protein n=1 Tax=Candidatus Methylumidiphilus alinenensis TaxID=2202197 RepID=A0A2W4RPF0_9GAMM|nr:MAG: hypothetical protein DM484_08010 [Candidatus Methylumidiphilus alinenensis]
MPCGWRPETGAARVVRGGSWNNNARNCRSAYRNNNDPDNRNNNTGFRCARAHDQAGRLEPEQAAIHGVGSPSPKPKGPRCASSGRRMPRERSPVGRLFLNGSIPCKPRPSSTPLGIL